MATAPFVVGQWVRGERFYGRDALLEEILEGPRNWLWLLGTRRIGKTSLLKQVEHVTAKESPPRYFPVFWDFQGSDSSSELHMGFTDALLDAEERLQEVGVEVSDIEHQDLFISLGKLRRQLRSRSRKLLLLCDEVEELLKLNQREPPLLRKLRRAMQSSEDVRSVLASTIRLWALADERGDTSPFLHGFSPPLYIHNLDVNSARALIRQANLPSDSRPRFDEDSVEAIRERCDNHPYLIQVLCKRCLELGDLDEAVEQVATDSMVSHFFSVDFEMLSVEEQGILGVIARSDASSSKTIQEKLSLEPDDLAGRLNRLEHLGYLRRNEQREFVLANYFFRRWFRQQPDLYAGSGRSRTRRQEFGHTAVTQDLEHTGFAGRYDLLQRIGAGAMGVVYKAYDWIIKDLIAIKFLRPEYSEREDSLERFRQEIWLARDLGHPAILPLYDLGECEGQRYLTMKWIEGGTLARLIRLHGPMPIEDIVAISLKLASALELAHSNHVIHRDIKPQNVLIDDRKQPYLTDFGLARLRDSPGMTKDGVFLGTPDYASPEQASLQPADERSDLYSLGVVIFEMATGERPFVAESTRGVLELHRTQPPPLPRSRRPEIPEVLEGIILRCLEKDPLARFDDAGALARAFEEGP